MCSVLLYQCFWSLCVAYCYTTVCSILLYQCFWLLCAASTAWIGAEYDGAEYRWQPTATAATLLQALNVDRSAGNCLVMSVSGLVAADCSGLHYVLCEKGELATPVVCCVHGGLVLHCTVRGMYAQCSL